MESRDVVVIKELNTKCTLNARARARLNDIYSVPTPNNTEVISTTKIKWLILF